jgi:peptidoglycan/LPS O-acetylase OafA/YrhL
VLARLDVGVAIFFVLSGFLLSRPWLVSAERGEASPAVVPYFWRRFLRIVPVYVVTAVIALVFIRENDGLGAEDWLKTLTLTNIYVSPGPPAGLTQMWSLATEVAFYVMLPLFMLLAVGRRRQLSMPRILAFLAACGGVSVLWLGTLSGQVPGAEDRAVNQWLPAFMLWFALGIGLAVLHDRYTIGRLPGAIQRSVSRLASSPGACWTAAAGLILVAATPLAGPTLLVPPTHSEAVTKNLLYAGVGALLVFSGAFTSPDSGYSRLMTHRWPRHLGHTSYSLFCIHLPVLHFVMFTTGYELFDGHFVQIYMLTLVLSLLAAEVLYRLVERPCMALKRWGPGSVAAPRTAATATTTR